MPLTLRLRFEGRSATLAGVPETITVEKLRDLLAEKTGVPAERQVIKCGVPPVPLKEAGLLIEAGCQDRDTLLLEQKVSAAECAATSEGDGTAAAPAAVATRKRRREPETAASFPGSQGSGNKDPHGAELLPAFDRAIRAAEQQHARSGEDKHQVWALKKGKAAVLESVKQGNNIALSALHTLTGVGHWVVQQVREHLEPVAAAAPIASKRSRASKAEPPTPGKFQWWYVGKDGKPVTDRNSAQVIGPLDAQEFRVGILHQTGRLEKAYLPDAKAPPRCEELPTFATGRGGK